MNDQKYMQLAIELASMGVGGVNPNPLVGAVVVKDGKVIAQGYHERYGEFHAERNALTRCQEDVSGATMYVTLEPCCHWGRTAPCTDIIIDRKIAKVVVGIEDPNPLVAGKGIQRLKEAGIEVQVGVCQEEILHLNRVFLKFIRTKLPYVLLKCAMTLDGKIATYSGDSKWISGEASRALVHELRNEMMGIVVGIGTVLADDPLLNCRKEGGGRSPIRIIIDSNCSTPLSSQIAQSATQYRTIIAHISSADVEKQNSLRELGIELLCCKSNDMKVDLMDLLKQLGELKIDSLLVEGGGEINGAFLQQHLIDEVYMFIAPKLVGGRDAKSPIQGQGIAIMNDAITLKHKQVQAIGDDILIRGFIN